MNQDPLLQQSAQGSYIAQALGEGAQANINVYPAPSYRPPLHRPPRAIHFTDREAELTQLLADLQPGRVVTLCGPGGIGKTALAVEAIWTLVPTDTPPERFPDGIIYYSFYNQPQAELALEAIARAFGEEPKPTPRDAAQRALVGRQALLLLDGTEASTDLASVLAVIGNCGVIVTSRRHKDAPDEWQNIAPLPVDEAVTLLQAWGKGWAADVVACQELCRLVGGLPLAVRLVGRYLAQTSQSATTYLAWLAKTPLQALDQGQRREESVPLLLERSLIQLSAEARQVWGVVGLLALAPFERAVVAAALASDESQAGRWLGELVDFGLLQSGEGYQVSHTLIHTYARRRLPVEAEVITRLVDYYTTFAREQQGSAGYAHLDWERAHLLRLVEGCAERQAWAGVYEVVWAIDGYLEIRGYTVERRVALEAAVVASQQLGQRRDEGACLGSLGNAYSNLGEVQRAIEFYEQALSIAREIGDRHNEGASLGNLGLAYSNLGQVEQAIEYYQQALSIAQDIGDHRNEGNWLGNLGLAYRDLGEVKRAIEYFEQALSVAREVGDHRNEGNHLGNLGHAYSSLGQFQQAIGYYQQALTIACQVGDRRAEGAWLGSLGFAYSTLGQFQQAIAYYQQALPISREIGDRRAEGIRLGNLGLTYDALGLSQQAIEHYQQALSIARDIGDRRNEGGWLGSLGNTYRNLGLIQQAIELYQQALSIACEIGDPRNEGIWLGSLGNAYYDLGEVQQAIAYYQQALPIAREIGDRHNEGACIGGLGLAYTILGLVQQAIEHLQQALSIARDIGDRRNEGGWLGNLGLAYRDLGEVQRAIEYYEQALAIAREIGDRRAEALHSWNLGLLFKESDPPQAVALMSVLVTYEQAIGHPAAETHAEWLAQIQARLEQCSSDQPEN
jgi:tetratricopeptide (TPR) repeat protein